jgi:hypothetical protein
MRVMKSPIPAFSLRLMLDSASEFAARYPLAHNVLTRLHAANIRITEVNPVTSGIWIGVGPGPNIVVYHTGTIVVQGAFYEEGPIGKLLKKALPANVRWQQ